MTGYGTNTYASGIWPSLFTLALTTALAVYSWRRRRLPGAAPFAVASALAALWVAGAIAESLSPDLASKVAWYKFQVVWQIPTITAIACFVLEYAWPGRWLKRRNLVLLSIAPVLMALMIMTNDLHHLMWVSLTADGVISPIRGPLNWPFIGYAIAFAAIQVVTLVWLILRSPSHRLPAVIMLVSVVFNRVVYVLNALNHPVRQYLPSDVSLVGIASVVFAVALFGFRILNPIAQAQLVAASQMSDGMLVVDADGRVASINPAAQAMLGATVRGAQGQPVRSLLPSVCGIDQPLICDGARATECVLAPGPAHRQVIIACSQLKDWRGLTSGRLILLRDVTAERKAQAQLLEQQRSLATLLERERLARELHDSLGQTLAAAHLQAGTARLLLEQGSLAETDHCLANLGEMTLAAEVDVREYIVGARSFRAGDMSFFEAVGQYMDRYGQLYGIQTEIEIPAWLAQRSLGPATETQLLRIIQEALSNVRKHAKARSCRVEFAVTGAMLQILVTDDGQGFDMEAVARRQDTAYGLHTMRERAESVGGVIALTSQPGRGTCVKVEVPLATP